MTIKMKVRMTAILCAVLLAMLLPGGARAESDLFEGMTVYDEGQYRVGSDMTPDEYVLLATDEYDGYFCISTDANKRDIVANDLFEVNSIVTVERGEYLELDRCVAIRAADFYTRYTIRSDRAGVMLKVGYDIEPGEYKLICTTDDYGYYCVYEDSRHQDITANDLFERSAWVSVKRGQYLILSRCVVQ